jgi:mannose-1-phosphate guanylyltransferase
MSARLHPVIVAGGAGTRLWPLSRRDRPKPFLSPDGGLPLIERAWRRARRLAPAEAVLVAVEGRLAGSVRRALPELPASNLLLEAVARDTGAAAGHAAWEVARRDAEGIMVFLPADHLVEDEARFAEAIAAAARAAEEHAALVCLGVAPAGPSSAYGYVECDGPLPAHGAAARVARFVEKPSAERARELLASDRLRASGDAERFFREAAPIAVDRAVMERTGRAWVVAAEMGWDDLGGWDAVARHLPRDADGNAGPGERLALASRGCLVHSPSKPVVLLGVEDLIVVECEDVLYVARRSESERTREIPERLRARGKASLT